jgi:hypothetical protein
MAVENNLLVMSVHSDVLRTAGAYAARRYRLSTNDYFVCGWARPYTILYSRIPIANIM